MFGDLRLAPYRLGQRSFQAVVLNAYHNRCAITGTKIRPVLEAAHIRPVTAGGEHRLDNGLLLRSDVHTLFDRGYLGVDPAYRLRVSPRLVKTSATVTGSTPRLTNGSPGAWAPPQRVSRVAPRRGLQSFRAATQPGSA